MTAVAVVAAGVYLVLITLAMIAALLVVVPVAVAVGAAGAASVAVASLVRRSGDREVPADDGAPADPARGLRGVEPAWRHYLAAQGPMDGAAAAGAVLGRTARMWSRVGTLRDGYEDLDDPLVRLALAPLLVLPVAVGASVTVGAAAAGALGGVVIGTAAGAGWTVRYSAVRVLRAAESVRLWRSGAGATCTMPHCFGHTRTPIVECRCGRYHLALEPGPYGALRRRCTCGTAIPSSITRAAAGLRLRCPWCREPLLPGSMRECNVRVVVIGAPGAGKSTLVDRALQDTRAAVVHAGGRFDRLPVPGPDPGSTRCTASRIVIGSSSATLHVFDPSGADLDDGSVRARMPFLRELHGLVLVIDAVALPRLAPRLDDPVIGAVSPVDPEVVYRAVVNQLTDDRVGLRGRPLAVVLHKADLLEASFRGRGPAPGSPGVRRWLVERGHRNLVNAAERDFGTVRYFLTSADGAGSASPATVLAFLAGRAGLPLPDPGAAG